MTHVGCDANSPAGLLNSRNFKCMQQENSKIIYDEYYRKSTDSEDRQVQSIDDQIRELQPVIERRGLKVSKRFEESMSAKCPGRPDFNELISRIESGKVNGIICWKINRLARNPIDGGRIQWLLQTGKIKSIVTPSHEFLPTDNVLMMGFELGQANQFSIDLGKDVTRGMKSKADKGWRPGKAPLGYVNDPAGLKGEKKVFKDPVRFTIVRQMWDALLTGAYSVRQIIIKANTEWGLRTRPAEKTISSTLSFSSGYKIFTNPFYYGLFEYKGELKPGKHEPMISLEEFDLAQKILGRAGKPRPKYKRLPFTGLIVCGQCGCMISCDEKIKFVKSLGRQKVFMYHRCNRNKKDVSCQQGSITYEELRKQIIKYLDEITIPEEFLYWALDALRKNSAIEEQNRDVILATHRQHYDECVRRIQNLVNLYICNENAKREMLSEEEFKVQKNMLIKEKAEIEGLIRRTEASVNEWVDLTERTFKFATYAKAWFEKGDYEIKTSILRTLGSKFIFTNGSLNITLEKPLLELKKHLELEPLKSLRCEPQKFALAQTKNAPLGDVNSVWSPCIRAHAPILSKIRDFG